MAQTSKRDNRTIAVALLVAAVIAAVGGISSYAAKYAHQASDDRTSSSPAFYFTSDLLVAGGNTVPTYNLPVGTTSFSFELRNYADDLRFSDTPIGYKYTVTKDSDGSTVKEETGTIANTENAPYSNKVSVTVDGLSAGTYTVTAWSTEPFSQTLTAKFVIASANDAVMTRVEDAEGSAYATLTVWTADYAGKVQVNWGEGLVPDQTQNAFAKVTTGAGGSYSAGNVTVSVEKFSSYTFRFFKTDTSKNYSSGSQISAAAIK